MPTMQVDAHELSKVKVEYISLVKRGANRLPIRILKGDTAVLDLDLYNQKQDRARLAKRDAVAKTSQAISDATLLLVQAGYKVIPAAGQGDDRADDGDAIDADPVTADNGANPAGPVKNVTGVAAVPGTTRLDDGSPNEFSPDNPSLSIGNTRTVANTTGVSDARTPGDGLCEAVPYQQQGSPVAKGDTSGKKPKKQPPGKPGADGLDAAKTFSNAAAADGDGDASNHNPGTGGKVAVSHGPDAPKKPVASTAVAKTKDPVEGTVISDADDQDLDDAENPVTEDDDEESADANQAAAATPSVVKSKTKKTEGDGALAQLLAGMAAMNANVAALSASVQKMDANVSAIDQKVAAVSARVEKTDKSLAALVPGQPRNDHEVRAVKNDTTSYPLIDTGYKSRL